MWKRILGLALFALLLAAVGADAGGPKVQLLDGTGLVQGTAAVNLPKGSVKFKANLAPLPATVDAAGDPFEATIYRAYLTSSTDEAAEVSLGPVYPTAKSKASVKAVLKGDLSRLGLDRVLVVAFSKDGLRSFDVLTGTLETP